MAIIQANLKAIGIETKPNPVSEKYFGTMAEGGCHFCRAGWYADYPTYGNFMVDLFSTASLGGNNSGRSPTRSSTPCITQAQARPTTPSATSCTSRPRTTCSTTAIATIADQLVHR